MIKTWQERCEEHPDHEWIVTEGMSVARMQDEIDDLRMENERFKAERDDLLEVLKAFSSYVRDEQNSTDGAVTYSTTAINHWAFLARAAIAKVKGEKA